MYESHTLLQTMNVENVMCTSYKFHLQCIDPLSSMCKYLWCVLDDGDQFGVEVNHAPPRLIKERPTASVSGRSDVGEKNHEEILIRIDLL